MKDIIQVFIDNIIDILPKIGGSILVLVTGFILGKILGMIAKSFAEKLKIDENFGNTAVGRALQGFNLSISDFIGVSFRWFIYIFSLLVSIDLLGIPALERFSTIAIEYLPCLLGGMLILIGGMLIAEIIAKILYESLTGINVPYSRLILLFTRYVLYSIVLVTSLFVMKIDVTALYSLLNAIFLGTAVGIGGAIAIAVGFGMKDYISKSVETWLETAEKTEKGQVIREYEDKIRDYQREVARLEEELSKERKKTLELEELRKIEIDKYEKVELELDKRLKELISDRGHVIHAKGGYRIEIKDISSFPLTKVLVTLTNNGFRASLEKTKSGYIIVARLTKTI
ncbi:MAG: hypothetical protein J7K23_07775 [Thermoproteales archaeon]|nr:hypothetical protein [Thermoproteales archaeon]